MVPVRALSGTGQAQSEPEGNIKAANLATTFDKICRKAGLPILPMIGNNMRVSCEKDLYSGKYPELRGRVDLIGRILGHSLQIALQYYQRFSTDDFAPLVESKSCFSLVSPVALAQISGGMLA